MGWVAPLVHIADRELFRRFLMMCVVWTVLLDASTWQLVEYESTTVGWVAPLVCIADIIVFHR